MTHDHELVRLAQAGDVDAFEALVQEHAVMAFRVALRIVRNVEDAQDVAQRALLSAWKGLPNFRGDAVFSTWLHQIVRRHALNVLARTNRTACSLQDLDLADPVPDPSQRAVQSDEAAEVHCAVERLPDSQRRAVRLRHFEGNSYAEIAQAMNSSVPAIRSHLFRARRALADELSPRV